MIAILLILVTLALLVLPYLPVRTPFTLCGYNYPAQERPKNLIFIGITLVLMLLTIIFMPHILDLADWFAGLKPVAWILDHVSSYASYSASLYRAVFANVLFTAAVLLAHALVRGTGKLLGRIPGKKSFKAWLEQRREAKKARKASKAAQQTGETTDQKDETTFPEHLLPKPEKPDYTGKVRVMGKEKRGTVKPEKKEAEASYTNAEADEGEKLSLVLLLKKLAGLFYVKGEDGWYVQPQCRKAAKHLRNFLVLVGATYLVIFTLLLIPVFFPVEVFAEAFYKVMLTLIKNCYLYPAVSLVVLTEVFWFMNGRLPEEPVDEPSTTWSRQGGRIVDLNKVEEDLMKTFGSSYEVRSFYTGDVEGLDPVGTSVDVEQDAMLQSVAEFVESQGLIRNDDYLRGVLALLEGEDTLFDAPLYTSAGMYLYPYLNMIISRGERLVVVCQDPDEIPSVIDNLRQGFKRVLRTHNCLWQISGREDLSAENQTDVLVLTPKDFRDDRLYLEGEAFFRRVALVMLPDAERVVVANNYYCLVLAERLRQHCRKKPQYLFLSTRHTLNLAGSLTQYFMLDQNIHTVQAGYAYGNIQLYAWKACNGGTILLDNNAQTVQMEVGIAKIAEGNGVPNINLVSGNAIFPNQVNSKWLDVYDAQERSIGFAIVADDSFNLPSVIYAYSRYMSKEASVLHVISQPYLLRDYFFERAARSIYEQPLMERGIAEHAESQRSAMILLLCRLMQGIPVEQFASDMHRITGAEVPEELTFPVLKGLAECCLRVAFGDKAAQHGGFLLSEEYDDQFRPVRKLRIQETGILDQLLADTALVTLRFTGARKDAQLGLFKKMLDQRYLVGQNLIYDHQNYEVCRIDREKGIILVDDANSVHNVPDDYIQVRTYAVEDIDPFLQGCKAVVSGETVEDEGHITGSYLEFQGDTPIKGLTMVRSLDALRIQSDTVAYYPVHGNAQWLDLTDSSVVAVKLSEARRAPLRRTVGQALYLKFEGDFVRSDRLTMTLAVLLQEMMKTLFPDQYFCVAVCPILEKPEDIYEHGEQVSSRIAGMYPKLQGWTAPTEGAIELLIVDDCEGGTGVLDMLYSPEGIYLRNVLDMLSDYLSWLEGKEEGSYIYFGAKSCPAIYDLNGLRELLKVFSRQYVREHDLMSSLQMSNCCEFCGQPLTKGSYLWQNRKNICEDCHGEYAPTLEEAEKILAYGQKFLSDRFGVTLPEGITLEEGVGPEPSALDVEAQKILLGGELPLTTVHTELMKQLVRLWQLDHLRMTGEPEFEGQVLYVNLQYLEHLKQFRRRRTLHRRALLGTDATSLGYCALRQALQTAGTDNSFRYMLENFPKGSQSPVRKTQIKRSTRTKDPAQVRRYFRETLSDKELAAYDRILQGVMAWEKEIDLKEMELPTSRFGHLWSCVLGDHPEIYWVGHGYRWTTTGDPPKVSTVLPNYYSLSKDELVRRQSEIDTATEQFLEDVTPEMGDYEAALMVYERLVKELDYDSIALEIQERRWDQLKKDKRVDEVPDDLRSIYGALVQKKAVCAGYAVAFQYLMHQLGIECLYVRGHCLKEGYHAWNIVKLEGSYYQMDVTWGDGSNTDPAKNRDTISYNYFCVTDEDMRKSRTTDAEPGVPPCTAMDCNYFVRNGLFFEAYDHAAIKARLIEKLEDPAVKRLDLRFANARLRETARRYLVDNGGMYEILRSAGRGGKRYLWSQYEPFDILYFTFEVKQEG